MANTSTSTNIGIKRRKELRQPDEFVVRTLRLAEWAQARRRPLLLGAAGVLAVVAIVGVWSALAEKQESHAATSLARALVVANAEIQPAGAPEESEEGVAETALRFQSTKSRSKAALHAYRRMLKQYPDSALAPVARLGEASELYDLGKMAEAKRAYETLSNADGLSPELLAQALDGLARCLEQEGDLDGALRKLEALRTMEEGAFRDLAQLARARIFLRQGKQVQARELLKGIQERLANPEGPDQPYVRAQVDARLREIEAVAPVGESPAEVLKARGAKSGGRSR